MSDTRKYGSQHLAAVVAEVITDYGPGLCRAGRPVGRLAVLLTRQQNS